jgi:hypothetical protein
MHLFALFTTLALTQDPTEPAATETAPPQAAVTPTVAPAQNRPKGLDEATKTLKALPQLGAAEKQAALQKLQAQFGEATSNAVIPPKSINLDQFSELTPSEQSKQIARYFFDALGNGDNNRMLSVCGLPFYLEDKRVEKADDLKTEWLKSLRSKRTDLAQLFDIEILSRAEMETKYGKPPARLSRWDMKAPNILFAVGNLSGTAHILMLKQIGMTWHVIAFHD